MCKITDFFLKKQPLFRESKRRPAIRPTPSRIMEISSLLFGYNDVVEVETGS